MHGLVDLIALPTIFFGCCMLNFERQASSRRLQGTVNTDHRRKLQRGTAARSVQLTAHLVQPEARWSRLRSGRAPERQRSAVGENCGALRPRIKSRQVKGGCAAAWRTLKRAGQPPLRCRRRRLPLSRPAAIGCRMLPSSALLDDAHLLLHSCSCQKLQSWREAGPQCSGYGDTCWAAGSQVATWDNERTVLGRTAWHGAAVPLSLAVYQSHLLLPVHPHKPAGASGARRDCRGLEGGAHRPRHGRAQRWLESVGAREAVGNAECVSGWQGFCWGS